MRYNVLMKHLEPFTDNALEWDGQKYVLTRQYCKETFEITFTNDGVLDRRRRKNARVCYNIIKNRLATSNMELGLWLINNTAEGRKFIKDLMTEQMEADLLNGYNDLGSTSAINVANGQVIDRAEIERNMLGVNAEIILDNTANYFPFNIFVRYPYPWTIRSAIYAFKR